MNLNKCLFISWQAQKSSMQPTEILGYHRQCSNDDSLHTYYIRITYGYPARGNSNCKREKIENQMHVVKIS